MGLFPKGYKVNKVSDGRLARDFLLLSFTTDLKATAMNNSADYMTGIAFTKALPKVMLIIGAKRELLFVL